MMRWVNEFKTFIQRGNVIDLAVGIIMGAAFGKMVSSLVGDVLMPPIGKLMGGLNFSELKWIIGQDPNDPSKMATLNYGSFIQTIVDFVIISFCVFLLVKLVNSLKRAEEAKPQPPSAQEQLLTQIRDILRDQSKGA